MASTVVTWSYEAAELFTCCVCRQDFATDPPAQPSAPDLRPVSLPCGHNICMRCSVEVRSCGLWPFLPVCCAHCATPCAGACAAAVVAYDGTPHFYGMLQSTAAARTLGAFAFRQVPVFAARDARRLPGRRCCAANHVVMQGQKRQSGCPLRCAWRGSEIMSDRPRPVAYHYMQDIAVARKLLPKTGFDGEIAGPPEATLRDLRCSPALRPLRPLSGGNLSQYTFAKTSKEVLRASHLLCHLFAMWSEAVCFWPSRGHMHRCGRSTECT